MTHVAYETAEALVRERLSDAAYAHSVAVAEMSGALATLYSVDVEGARLAGLLHDWDRERDRGELVPAARDAGLPVTQLDEDRPRLLHAYTGAESLRVALPGVSDEVLRAVERHTLGAADMSDLDMIVYVADMIAEGREYPGVDDLREAAGSVSLQTLFALAYRHTLQYLINERLPIHPTTVEVWNALVAGGDR